MSKQTMTAIDPAKLRAFVEGKGAENVTRMIGKAPGYFHNVYARKSMPTTVLNAMCAIYGIKPIDVKPDPPKPVSPPVQLNRSTYMPSSGYALDLRVYPEHVSLTLYEDSKQLKCAKARIKNGEKASKLDTVQAISYAAHMLYKFVEQDAIE